MVHLMMTGSMEEDDELLVTLRKQLRATWRFEGGLTDR
jgi:hypothetical protein